MVTLKQRVWEPIIALQSTDCAQNPPSPTDGHKNIMDISPTDLKVEENVFDSDGLFEDHVSLFSYIGGPVRSKSLFVYSLFILQLNALKRKYEVKKLHHQDEKHKLELELLTIKKQIKIKKLEKQDLEIQLLKLKMP